MSLPANAMRQVAKTIQNSSSELSVNSHTFRLVFERVNLLALFISTGIDTPYMGLPLAFLLTLAQDFPFTPPQGCGLLAGLINQRIHPNAYTGRHQAFDENFIGSALSTEEKVALEKNNGKGVKLCREETAGWESGKGWTPNAQALTNLAFSFMGVFNSNHPIENEPQHESDIGTQRDIAFNKWIENAIMHVYSTPKFWEKLYSPEVISYQELAAYFSANADVILARIDEALVDYKNPKTPSPYINDGHGCFGFGSKPTMMREENIRQLCQENFGQLKAMFALPQEVAISQLMMVKRAHTDQMIRKEERDFYISLSLPLDADYGAVPPKKSITLEMIELEHFMRTKTKDYFFGWKAISYWSEEYKWSFPVWDLVCVVPLPFRPLKLD